MWTTSDKPEMTILIVDDKRRNLFALEQVLKDVPARIITATSGDEALALSIRHPVALAILDVQMPGMDGYELAELLLGSPSATAMPVIFVSAACRDESHSFRGYETGAVDYLLKPIDPMILRAKVMVFLELARTRAALEDVVVSRTEALLAKAEQLARRSRYKALMAEVSRDLIRRDPSVARSTIAGALAQVGTFVEATYGFVTFDVAGVDDPWELRAWMQWRATQDAPPLCADDATSCCASLIGCDAIQGGNGVAFFVSDPASPLAVDERTRLEARGVEALVLLPIIEEGRVVGAVGFAWAARRPPVLSRETVRELPELLTTLPDLIYATLQRAEADALLMESQAQHRLLFVTMAQGVIYQDVAGLIIAANPAAERILGLNTAQLAGRDSRDRRWQSIHEDGSPFLLEEQPAVVALRTGKPMQSVMMGVMKPDENEYRWIMVAAVPLFRPGEKAPFQVYTTLSDLTDLKRATAEKERLINVEAECRAKSGFLASMSHEIRTPLNAIIGYTSLLLGESTLTAKQRDYLETVDRSGDHLITLINNILDMASIEAGKEPMFLAMADVGDLLTDTERMFRLRATEKHLDFRVERGPTSPRHLRVDAGKVRQVLINLLGNSMKFTEHGEIVLRSWATPVSRGSVRVTMDVRDTGMGIPADKLSDIFEPFAQVSRTATANGTGIGLAVCRRFARMMGGDVTVTSSLGAGSTFRFEFEAEVGVADAAETSPVRIVGIAPGAPRAHVLLVEPDADARRMTAETLASVGVSVRATSSVTDALSALDREHFDAVITDIMMPSADGLELTRLVRKRVTGASVPVVVVSASTMRGEHELALAAGASGFVAKPLRESDLFGELSRLTRTKFVHAGELQQRLLSPVAALTRESLTEVPTARRMALTRALRMGYIDAIDAEIDAIELGAPQIAGELRRCADRFDYKGLVELLGAEVN